MFNRFQKFALATTIATFILIMIGGFVRASDSGLGCPDWPTCFGKPYPPLTRADLMARDLPENFDAASFNITTAWVEYFNRLSGTVIGLLVIGTLATALRDHRHNRRILLPTIGAFITVLLNGWLGSQVVESELNPLTITAHLTLAWVQMALLLYATVSAFFPEGGIPRETLPPARKKLATASMIVLIMVLVQAAFGADLRGQLEVIERENPALARADWIHEADWVDQVHRSYSWLVMAGIFWLAWFAHRRMDFNPWLRYATQLAVLLVIIQVAAGIGLAYVALPPPLQLIHLVNATLLITTITLIYLLATRLPIHQSPLPMPGTLRTAHTAGD